MRPLQWLRGLLVVIVVCGGRKCHGLDASVCVGQGVSYSLNIKCSDSLVIAITDMIYGVDDKHACKQQCCVTQPTPQCTEVSYNAAVAACTGRSACLVDGLRIAAVDLMTCDNATATFLHVTFNCTPEATSAATLVSTTLPGLSSPTTTAPRNLGSTVMQTIGNAGTPADTWLGLSTEAKIGLGVGAGCAFVLAVVLTALLLLRQRQRRLSRRTAEDEDHGFVDDSSRWDDAQSRIKKRNDSLIKHTAANKRPSKKGSNGAVSSSGIRAADSQLASTSADPSTDQKSKKSSNRTRLDPPQNGMQQEQQQTPQKAPTASTAETRSHEHSSKTIESTLKQQPQRSSESSAQVEGRRETKVSGDQAPKSDGKASATAAAGRSKPADVSAGSHRTSQKREPREKAQPPAPSGKPAIQPSIGRSADSAGSGGRRPPTGNAERAQQAEPVGVDRSSAPVGGAAGNPGVREVKPLPGKNTSSQVGAVRAASETPNGAEEPPSDGPGNPPPKAPKPAKRKSQGSGTSID